MATQNLYQPYAQNKGTLVPGQSISVGKFTVQVERYLSQGGFAHVYLVRTPAPVYNTTHHVLKRIAVSNEAMLTEVKKEVDIMRLLKGHPNIVHLIDAAWHRTSNGVYEVFILMEFCAGGGIIDMMNRRLRERLTEAEILQIFVDVCEGVACMHNLRPPLLHRDLKVENILQSSPTSFKLCDFGSATTVTSKPPSTTQEIRALEADLSRHTTLQYRAPEMVDPYLRRPVDEKSDVWALGVLLYKLCYYTTPFEEHGPLAILNVQYRIPPYPVYSAQMNALIASMLREHGTQRPNVFELLAHVHRLRGTKSQFHYTIPAPPPLSPRQSHFTATSSPNHLESTISYRSAQKLGSSPDYQSSNSMGPKNPGVQAREKVLEAIAPMRRGRPTPSKEGPSSSQPGVNQKPSDIPVGERNKNWLEDGFQADEERAWNTIKTEAPSKSEKSLENAWRVSIGGGGGSGEKERSPGFGDDFSTTFWGALNSGPAQTPKSTPQIPTRSPDTSRISPSMRPPAFTGSDVLRPRPQPVIKSKDSDAFEGLGLLASDNKPAPTLAEARKLRTGLAVMNSTNFFGSGQSQGERDKSISRPSPSPSQLGTLTTPSYQTPATFQPSRPNSRPPSSLQADGLPVESRFPSLAELDASFGPSTSSQRLFGNLDLYPSSVQSQRLGMQPPQPSKRNLDVSKPSTSFNNHRTLDGTRSEQVTGSAMRESRDEFNPSQSSAEPAERQPSDAPKYSPPTRNNGLAPRVSLTRKHRSSITIKHIPGPSPDATTESPDTQARQGGASTSGSSSNAASSTSGRVTRDWLTEDDGDRALSSQSFIPTPSAATPTAIVRGSPGKRTSIVELRSVPSQKAVVGQPGREIATRRRTPSPLPTELVSPTISKFTHAFPPLDLDESITMKPESHSMNQSLRPAETRASISASPISSGDEGPEEADGYKVIDKRRERGPTTPKRKGRQSSVHDLVDLWGGSQPSKDKEVDKEERTMLNTTNSVEPQGAFNKELATLISSRPDHSPKQPPQTLLPPLKEFNGKQAISTHQKQPSPVPSPGSSSRSRPQSMFISPSPKTAQQEPVSPGLMPPDDPKPRSASRRTSISDMVQRFEAIGGKPKPSGPGQAPPSPLGTKTTFKPIETARPAWEPEKPQSNLSLLSEPSREPAKRRASPTFRSTSPGFTRTQATTPQKEPAKESEYPGGRVRTSSFRPDAVKLTFPLRKTTTDETSPPPRSADRSSSPERPYQGVGKLIDQWQRKTAEAEAQVAGPNKRVGFSAKRTGAVQGGQ